MQRFVAVEDLARVRLQGRGERGHLRSGDALGGIGKNGNPFRDYTGVRRRTGQLQAIHISSTQMQKETDLRCPFIVKLMLLSRLLFMCAKMYFEKRFIGHLNLDKSTVTWHARRTMLKGKFSNAFRVRVASDQSSRTLSNG
ncbi:hypothetical protein [Paraburkholderia sp. JPY419]|uniref:hypothetical protein n=1 Tax=Paraburkholderia sp. JPY419 TaxID=667660 RepID=UPI003D1B13C5